MRVVVGTRVSVLSYALHGLISRRATVTEVARVVGLPSLYRVVDDQGTEAILERTEFTAIPPIGEPMRPRRAPRTPRESLPRTESTLPRF